jgi:hypothetical protein
MCQMVPKKAPYYPGVYYTTKVTPFGALETDYATLYDTRIDGRTIMKVDCLGAIRRFLGDNVYRDRKRLYKLLSGSCSEKELRDLLTSFYVKYNSFANYTDDAIIFGGDEKTTLTKVIEPLRNLVDKEIMNVSIIIEKSGGKIAMVTHDYVYAIFSHTVLPDIENAVVISK